MFIAMNLPLGAAFAASHELWYVVSIFIRFKIFVDLPSDFFFDLVVQGCFV